MACLLMTRPREAAERFVASLPPDLRARLSPVFAPLIEIAAIDVSIRFDDARGIIFTSANGVAVAATLTDRRDLPCYCVGEATTRAAQDAGWRAECAGEDARTLVQTLIAAPPATPLLHLRGAHASSDVAADLSLAGCATRVQAIYDQKLLPLSDAALVALDGTDPVIVPLFSPRTARQFANCVTGRAPLLLAAISQAAAKPLCSLTFSGLQVAERPDARAMVRAVAVLADWANRVEGGSGAQ